MGMRVGTAMPRSVDLPNGTGRGLAGRDWPEREALAQRLPLEQLEHDVSHAVIGADVMDGQDVRMVESRHRLGFLLEPAEAVGLALAARGHDLECDVPPEARVTRPIDLAHSPGADRGQDLVGAEPAARDELHEKTPDSTLGVANLK
jgi:hypothetical protein